MEAKILFLKQCSSSGFMKACTTRSSRHRSLTVGDPIKKKLYSSDLPGFISEMTTRYVVWTKDHPKGEDSRDNSTVLNIEARKPKKGGNTKPSSSPPTVPGTTPAPKSSTSTGSSEGRKEWAPCPMCEKKHPPGCANENAIKSYFEKQRSKVAEDEKKLIEEAKKKSAELAARKKVSVVTVCECDCVEDLLRIQY